MYCALKRNFNDKNIKGRFLLAFICFVSFLTVFLLPEVFILLHADHEHDRHGADGCCAKCIYIQNAEYMIRQFGTVTAEPSSVFTGWLSVVAVLFTALLATRFQTLVLLKIRMDD